MRWCDCCIVALKLAEACLSICSISVYFKRTFVIKSFSLSLCGENAYVGFTHGANRTYSL